MAHRSVAAIVALLPAAVNSLGVSCFLGELDRELVGGDIVPLGAADGDGRVGAAVPVGQPQRRRARQVALTPLEHRPHHRHEVESCFGEHVLVAASLARFTVGLPFEQAGFDEVGQPRGRRGLGHTDASPEVVEPSGAVVGLSHDQHRRLGAQQGHCLLDRTRAHR